MKKFLGTIKRSGSVSTRTNGHKAAPPPQGDSPEAVVVREVTAFCEAGAPNAASAGDEYLHLPAIVDAAESSPVAAREAAGTIRRFLSKDQYQRGFAQYNAIMLARILTDNPARTFTQNFDEKFVRTVKDLLRDGRDTSVQQILRETLDYFEADKVQENDTLQPLIDMWRKEKGRGARIGAPRANFGAPMGGQGYAQQGYASQGFPPQPRGLPPPEELAGRIEEAKTTARLLVQTVQSTPTSELLGNDLVREFAERAHAAHKNIQGYMQCENPAPDTQTMLTMIETTDHLNIAISKHQRSILQARQQSGLGTPSPQPPQSQPGSYVYPQTQNNADPYANARPPQQTQVQPPLQPQRQPQQQYSTSHGYPQTQDDLGAYGRSQPQPVSQNYPLEQGGVSNFGVSPQQLAPQAYPPRKDNGRTYAAPPPEPALHDYHQGQDDVGQQQHSASYGHPEDLEDDDGYRLPQESSQPHPAFQRQAQFHAQAQNHDEPYETAHLQQSTPRAQVAAYARGVPESPIDDDFYASSSPQRLQKSQPRHDTIAEDEDTYNTTSAQAYGIAENPFSDDAGIHAAGQHGSSAFEEDDDVPTTTATGFPHRPSGPNPYNEGYQPTPSYMHRQDSSVEHITMHGASSPPTSSGTGRQTLSPVSPLNEQENDMSSRMNNVRI